MLTDANPVQRADLAAFLRPEERLLIFISGEQATLAVLVDAEGVQRVHRIDMTPADMANAVQTLRCGLDEAIWLTRAEAIQQQARCLQLGVQPPDLKNGALNFKFDVAYALYRALIQPFDELIKNKDLVVIATGPLSALPLHVLVTAPGETDYARASWLVRNHAITVIPSVASLKALRQQTKPATKVMDFLGVGNPLLEGEPKDETEATLAKAARQRTACETTSGPRIAQLRGMRRATATMRSSGLADVQDLRSWLPLPETVDELCAVAHDFSNERVQLLLGSKATEFALKDMSSQHTLAKFNIVHFATHAAVAGEITAGTEPGLILTPPDKGTEQDDGYLSASEIAELQLDADWIVLSACNTAAGDGSSKEALSGLARAFFHAGARALLVSHWAVNSVATPPLVTKTFNELRRNTSVGRSEALRRAMLSMIDSGNPEQAHPAFWAPFIIVGEGGAQTTTSALGSR